jgi:Rod binding domain-containing protein
MPSPSTAMPAELQLEGMLVQPLLQSMFPKARNGYFGSGFAGEQWQSMMSSEIASRLAASGTLQAALRRQFPGRIDRVGARRTRVTAPAAISRGEAPTREPAWIVVVERESHQAQAGPFLAWTISIEESDE